MQTGGRPGARDVPRDVTRCLPIQGIAHLDNDKHRQSACLGFGGVENIAVDAWEHPGLGRALHMMRLTTTH